MKKNIIILLLLAQSISAGAQGKWNKEPYITKSLKDAGINAVFVETSGGSITVSGVKAGEEPRVEVFVSGNNDNDDLIKDEIAKRLADNYNMDITTNSGELHAVAKSKNRSWDWKKSLSISFKVYVPQKSATNLATSGGSIHLTNLTGQQNFTTSGGSLHVDDIKGDIKGRTSGGSISASNCEGDIELTTSGGSLNLSNLKGITHAVTSGGSIKGEGIAGELITSTSGGSINLTDLSCSVNASTSAGSVHVQLKALNKYVKISVSAGHVDLQIPAKQGADLKLRGSRVTADLPESFSGTKETGELTGKINGGGVPVEVHAGFSNVRLAFN